MPAPSKVEKVLVEKIASLEEAITFWENELSSKRQTICEFKAQREVLIGVLDQARVKEATNE